MTIQNIMENIAVSYSVLLSYISPPLFASHCLTHCVCLCMSVYDVVAKKRPSAEKKHSKPSISNYIAFFKIKVFHLFHVFT